MVAAVQANLLYQRQRLKSTVSSKTLPASQKVSDILHLAFLAKKSEAGGMRSFTQTTFLRETATETDISYGTLLKMWHGEYRIGALQLDQAEKLARFLGIGQVQLLWGLLGNSTSPLELLRQTAIWTILEKEGYTAYA